MDRPPALPPELVNNFVREAHRSLDKVKELLNNTDALALVNATWDWGGGDYETALGAAAHVGQREIAEYLLDNGAHMTIYAAAMLGKLDIVKAILADNPKAIHYKGAHGIPLIAHAERGGELAKPVLDYLHTLMPEQKSE